MQKTEQILNFEKFFWPQLWFSLIYCLFSPLLVLIIYGLITRIDDYDFLSGFVWLYFFYFSGIFALVGMLELVSTYYLIFLFKKFNLWKIILTFIITCSLFVIAKMYTEFIDINYDIYPIEKENFFYYMTRQNLDYVIFSFSIVTVCILYPIFTHFNFKRSIKEEKISIDK